MPARQPTGTATGGGQEQVPGGGREQPGLGRLDGQRSHVDSPDPAGPRPSMVSWPECPAYHLL
ncbi:hypothetical protein [Frankia sp. EAN1pec]|uniref:hypothetical protein n=1 Tax=Parafrankia sp. (strain EAN1pec) TaxID=298653 RepID=UPI00059ED167